MRGTIHDRRNNNGAGGRGAVAPAVALVVAVVVVLPATPVGAGPGSGAGLAPLSRLGFVYEGTLRGVRYYKDTDAQALRVAAEGKIAVPPARVARILLNYDNHVGLFQRVAESRVLARGDGWLRVYQRIALPVVQDRDYVLAVRWEQGDDGRTTIRYRTARKGSPAAVDGVVRVTHNRGTWTLVPVDGGAATLARLTMSMDLGGSLPGWMARARGGGEEVVGTFTAMRKLVRSSGAR